MGLLDYGIVKFGIILH